MTHIDGDGEIQLMSKGEAGIVAKIVSVAPPCGVDDETVSSIVDSLDYVSELDPVNFPINLADIPEKAGVELDDEVEAVDVVLGSMKRIRRIERPPRDPLKVFARYFLGEIHPDIVAGH